VGRRRQAQGEFEGFVRGQADRLVRVGYLITGDLSEAEDFVQEALARVARRWGRVATMASPAGYARRVLVNIVIDSADGRSRRGQELADTASWALGQRADPGSEEGFAAVDGRLNLLRALVRLPARQRAVLVLRYWEDLSEADTAELLGISPGTVKSMASRGLVRLREVLAGTESTQEVI
jgi:RNA polymerase sigma-70 factor (sigma-E family)